MSRSGYRRVHGRSESACSRSLPAGLRSDDRGTVTIVAAGGVLLLLSITMVVIELGAVVATRHRAQSVADLAALAAAAAADHGVGEACGEAQTIALHTPGARLSRCTFEGWDAVVTVWLESTGVPAVHTGAHVVIAFARAGPIDDDVH